MTLNHYIDHTLLKPEASKEQILSLIEEAKRYKFASVCVNPYWVELAANQLAGSSVNVCTVIGFPLGAAATEVKAYEASVAVEKGADELDMVINIGALKSGLYEQVQKDIESVVKAGKGALIKVIIETCLLTAAEKVKACELAQAAGADFVKTSTGFSTGGATIEDIKLMRQTVGLNMGVKAAGGARSYEDAQAFIEAGATRIGTSAGIAIMEGQISDGSY